MTIFLSRYRFSDWWVWMWRNTTKECENVVCIIIWLVLESHFVNFICLLSRQKDYKLAHRRGLPRGNFVLSIVFYMPIVACNLFDSIYTAVAVNVRCLQKTWNICQQGLTPSIYQLSLIISACLWNLYLSCFQRRDKREYACHRGNGGRSTQESEAARLRWREPEETLCWNWSAG